MAKYVSGRQKNLKVGISSYSENLTSLEVIGNVGIATTNATSKLYVIGDGYFTGVVTSSSFYVGSTLVSGGSSFSQLYVSGITTLAANGGITTTGGDLYVGGDLYIADDLVFDEFTARNGNISGIGTITNLNSTNLSGTIGTITTLNSTNATVTNINSSGISTLGVTTVTRLTAQSINSSGIVTGSTFRPSTGYIQASDGTNSFYIYSGTGNVAFQGTIGASQINSASGYKALDFGSTTTPSVNITNNLNVGSGVSVVGVVTASSFSGNASITQLSVSGVSTFSNNIIQTSGSVGIGTTNPLQTLQVGTANTLGINTTGTVFVVTSNADVGIGTTNPITKLDVRGNVNISGVVTASSFSGNASSATYATSSGIATYATTAGIATYATSSGIATYATTAGVSTSVIGGIASVTQLSVSGVSTFNNNVYIPSSSVGLGTTNPLQTLQVGTANTLGVNTTGTVFVVTSNADVGIGTTNPIVKLDVRGNVNITGVVTASSFSGNASSATYATSSGIATYATTAGIATYATSSGIATYATNAGVSTYATTAGIATYASTAGIATYATSAGIATYASNAGIATYASTAGIATYATTAGIATYATTAGVATALQNARNFSITGNFVTAPTISFNGTGDVALAATITTKSIGLGTYTTGDYVKNISGTANQITVTGGTGEGSTPTLSIPSQFTVPQDLTVTRDVQINRNLNVTGNITIGGTTAFINVQQLQVADPDLVLGVRTDALGNDASNDTTANHGGIAIASTEGNPLVSLYNPGIGESTASTYKKIMWFKSGSFTGLNTDAWLINYAVGIGSTQFPSGTRLAAGSVQFTERDLAVVRNINASGIITGTLANTLTLNTSGTGLSGSATYNNSGAATFTVASNATSNNTPSTIVARDASGNFSAGTITANLTGTASTASFATTAFNLSDAANITTGTINSARLSGTYNISISGNAATATYATSSGIATYATTAGIATYATNAGVATVSQGLTGTPNITVGIVTATSYNGSGTNLTGIVTQIIAGTNISINPTGGTGAVTVNSNAITGVSISTNTTNQSQYLIYATSTGSTTGFGVSTSGLVFNPSTNNLGIATTNPTSRFYVVGDGFFTGVVTSTSFVGNLTGTATTATNLSDAANITTGIINSSRLSGTYNIDINGNAATATYATNAGIATYATSSGIATYATNAGIATYATNAGIATYATSSGIATYATSSGIATYATSSGIATYATSSGIATYATSSGIATYATSSGIATYATSSGIATYATTAGVSTSVIGGIASVTQLSVSGVSTFNNNVYIPSSSVGIGTTNPLQRLQIGTANTLGINTTGTVFVVTSNADVGIGTTNPTTKLDVRGNVNISGVITASSFSGNASSATYATSSGIATYATSAGVSTSVIGGIGSITQLQVTGVSTFSNGPVLIGSATSTGTASQPLQVTGGAYVSGNLGIGTTNPTTKLDVSGVIRSGRVDTGNEGGQIELARSTDNATAWYVDVFGNTSTPSFRIVDATASASRLSIDSAGTVSATKFSGDGSLLTGIAAGIAVQDEGSTVGTSVTTLNFSGASVSVSNVVNGISTVTVIASGIVTYVDNAGIATNLKGGLTGNIPYQSATDTTVFLANGSSGTILQSNGVGNAPSWVPAAPASAITGLTVRDEGTIVGGANSVSQLNFVGNIVSVASTSGIATVTFLDYVSNSGVATYATNAGTSTSVIGGIASVTQLSVSGVSTFNNNVYIPSSSVGLGTTNPLQRLQIGTANTLGINTTGTVFVITSNADVGIGTTNPIVKLDVRGNVNITGVVTATTFVGTLTGTATTATNVIGGIASVTQLSVSGVSTFNNNVYIPSSSVGIGTTNPLQTLQVGTANTLGVNTTGTVFVVTSNADVGIGTTNPTTKLDVRGNVNISGVVTATTFVGTLTGTATTATNVIGGIGSITQLSVSGVSTFNNNVYIPSSSVGIGTTNPLQRLQIGTANTLGVNTTGTVFVVTSNADVGIGTTNPIVKLDVRGNVNISGVVTASSFSGNASSSTYATSSGIATYATSSGIATYATSSGIATYSTTSGVSTSVIGGIASITQLSVSGVSTFSNNIIQTSGSVGIGTTNPLQTLQVGTANTLGINTTGTVFVVTSNADVGIGTTNPIVKLDVRGNVNITGVVTASSFSGNASSSTYATSSGIATYATTAGIATYATSAGIATYATTSGVSTSVIGGIASVTQLSVSGVSTFSNNIIQISGSVGIGTTNPLQTLQVGTANTLGINTTGTVFVVTSNADVGIGTTNPTTKLDVRGNVNISGVSTFSGIATHTTSLFGTQASFTGVVTASLFSGSGANLTSLNASQLTSGTVPSARITASSGDFTVGQNLFVTGNLSVGGTSVILNAATLTINDRDIVVGYTTDVNNNDVSNDNTANHGGISVASTVGSPIINIPLQAGINSNPFTYKQFMWIKSGNYSGMGTDAWVSNYAISIGNTSTVQNGSRLTVGTGFTVFDTYLDATDIRSRNINATGVVTATTLVKSGGTSSQFLKADGSVDSNTYLTTESDTLNTVTNRGNSTSNGISVGVLTATSGNFSGIITSSGLNVSGVSTFFSNIIQTSGSVGLGTTNPLQRLQIGTANTLGVNTTGTVFVVTSNADVGIGTTNPIVKLDVRGDVNISGVVTATTFVGTLTGTATTATNVIGGIGSITQLQVTGISTFSNGPVLIGSATSTGTASQPLQVTGGAYVSGSVGIGTTNPVGQLQVSSGPVIIGAATSTGTASQRLQVTGGAYVSGNLGIAVTAPSFAVDVSGDTRVQSTGKMRFGGTSGTTNFYIQYNSTTNSLDFVAG